MIYRPTKNVLKQKKILTQMIRIHYIFFHLLWYLLVWGKTNTNSPNIKYISAISIWYIYISLWTSIMQILLFIYLYLFMYLYLIIVWLIYIQLVLEMTGDGWIWFMSYDFLHKTYSLSFKTRSLKFYTHYLQP